MNYQELLTRGRKSLPESALVTERFVVPNIRGHVQGNRTVLSNFSQIVSLLRREQEHFLKYILKELATPGELKGQLVFLGRKVSASIINQKIQDYVQKYVVCKECGRPDTTLTKQERTHFIKCNACGARYSVN